MRLVRNNKISWASLLDLVGSVRFGVTILVLILLWSWLGSAGTAPFGSWFIRQSVEKTEMEWFAWWPFQLLLGLLILSVTLVTIRKIPLRLAKVGVWTIHAGVVVLCVGGWIYFGRKLEGDLLVYRREAVLQADGGAEVRLPVQEGATARIPSADGDYVVAVLSANASYELLTGDDRGRTDYAVQLSVTPPAGREPFIRQLLAGHPEYTEDVLPGRGRAIKSIGRALVDEHLTASLDYASADRLHLVDRFALHARASGESEWIEYPLPGLPRFHERLARPADAVLAPGETARRVRALDLHPAPRRGSEGLPGVSYRITGFLPSATLEESWEPGGSEFRPLVRFTTEIGPHVDEHLLVSGNGGPHRVAIAEGLSASFVWLSDDGALSQLLHPGRPEVTVKTAAGSARTIPVADLLAGEIGISGGYTLQAQRYEPDWTITGTGEPSALLLVRVHGPRRNFVRAAFFPQADQFRDFDTEGNLLPAPADPDLDLRLENAVAPGLLLAGTPGGLHALLVSDDGEVQHRPVTVGQPVDFLDGALCLTIDAFSATSRASQRPVVIPESERDPKDGAARALLQVEIHLEGASGAAADSTGNETQTTWVEYSHYTHPSRLGFHPRTVELPGLPPMELCFSRETVRLPAAVALDDFAVETYPGGTRERSYQSLVRFREKGRWSAPLAVRTNGPTEHSGWWFFQSTWDPPEPSSGYAGMNYSGLGVGNHHGVGILLAGAIMIVLGTAWTFYVKPALLLRAGRGADRADRAFPGQPGSRRISRDRRVAGVSRLADAMPADSGLPALLTALAPLSLLVGGSLLAGSLLAPVFTAGRAHAEAARVAAEVAVAKHPATSAAEHATAEEQPAAPTTTWPLSVPASFLEAIDLSRLRVVAVQEDGRVKTFDSLARDRLRTVNTRLARRVDPVAWYLDLVFASEQSDEVPLIRLGKPAFRHRLMQVLRGFVPPPERLGRLAESELDRIDREGTASRAFLGEPAVRSALAYLQRDLVSTGKEVQRLDDALALSDRQVLEDLLRVMPVSTRPVDRWMNFQEAAAVDSASLASLSPGSAPIVREAAQAWTALAGAWTSRDPAAAQGAIDRISGSLPRILPAAYPAHDRLTWEHWYYRNDKLTGTWLVYFFALPLLLMAWVYGFRWARVGGLLLFAGGFALHTLAIGVRWWLAGRIPNSNMFEAITASAWFGGLAALILEFLLRRRPMRNLPALAASVYAMLVLMAGHFVPILLPGTMDSGIGQVMPVLDRTVWLYIHTNIVIASYALIFLGSVTALLYLGLRGVVRVGSSTWLAERWTGVPHAGAAQRFAPGSGPAGALVLGGPGSFERGEAGLSRALDGATMIFLQLAFLALWIGTILGAVWADLSWGRPWGWDPKEVFALNTWIVFLILVHVRLRARDKALWTALLAVVGCLVMLFNWIAVNFVIVGLHSYA